MSLSSYYRQYDKQNLAELERQKEALRQMSETQKQLVNDNADASIKQIEETGNANIREAEHAYDGVINTANVQKLINERQVAERMANLGLTDSGLNRTQQTAVQLSHSNSINKAMVARQKQIDALALAINQQIGQVNIQRHNDLTNLDLAHQQNLYSLDEQYRAGRNSWAASAYDADQQAAAARYKADLEYNENLIKMGLDAEEQDLELQKTERTNLIKVLRDKNLSSKTKKIYVDEYFADYGAGDDATLYAEIENAGVYKFGNSSVQIGTEFEVANRNRVQYYVKNLPKKVKTRTEAIEYIAGLYEEGNLFPEEAEYITRYVLETYEDDGK